MVKLTKINRLFTLILLVSISTVALWACKDSSDAIDTSLDEVKLSRLAKTYASEVTDAQYEKFNEEFKVLNEKELIRFYEIVMKNEDITQEQKELFLKKNIQAIEESKKMFNKPFNQLDNKQTYEFFDEVEKKENARARQSGLCQSVTYGNQRASIVNGYNTGCASVYYVSPKGQSDFGCDIECQFSGLNKSYSTLPIDGSTARMRSALNSFPAGTIMARQSGNMGYILLGIRVFGYVNMKNIVDELKMKK